MPDYMDYPKKSELRNIKHFYGTIDEFFDYVESVWTGNIRRENVLDDFGRPVERITFTTGGWSGCEEVIDVVLKTLASTMTYSMWKRGGLYEFEIRHHLLNLEPRFWGNPKFAPREAAK